MSNWKVHQCLGSKDVKNIGERFPKFIVRVLKILLVCQDSKFRSSLLVTSRSSCVKLTKVTDERIHKSLMPNF